MERKRSKAARNSRERAQPAAEPTPEKPALIPVPERAAEPENLPQTVSAELPIELEEAEDYSESAASAQAGEDSAAETGEAHADGGPLVQFDPLSRYLTEIRRFPLLSREEELAIARRYNQDHDPRDAYQLVTANLRLVVKIAYEFARASKNLLDLIQEGNVGLMEAVKNFDPNRGIRFPSYAVWWVRAYIYRYLINNWRLVKIGTTQAQRKLFFNLRKEMERLQAEGIEPQPRLLAQRLGVKESEVVEMQERLGHSELSLDQPVGGDEQTQLLDVLPDPSHNPENQLADAQFRDFARDRIEEFAKTLSGKELEIFRHRLLSEEPMTLQEMGEKFGISRERVRQIENRLKRQLRDYVKSQAPDIEQART
ncbi:MAG TPA: RNA polymerase factor sigma-32 [Candidatus Binataceae bacterium]|nr:RNA polymerase factor sigma-32 [Candidatus Binataceae bacterium]